MRHVTEAGLALIQRFEGFSAKPYLCPAGWWTIGWGAVRWLDGQQVTRDTRAITQEEGRILLGRDTETAKRAVIRLIAVPLADGQFDALVSFAFNLGGGALQRSTLRQKVNREEHAEVPPEFLKWVWAGGRQRHGLISRRTAEAHLYSLPPPARLS